MGLNLLTASDTLKTNPVLLSLAGTPSNEYVISVFFALRVVTYIMPIFSTNNPLIRHNSTTTHDYENYV